MNRHLNELQKVPELSWGSDLLESGDLDPHFFGPQCAALRAFASAVEEGRRFDELRSCCESLLNKPLQSLHENAAVSGAQCDSLARGILNTVIAACDWVREERNLTKDAFARAVAAFRRAWPGTDFRVRRTLQEGPSELARTLWPTGSPETMKTRGFWVAWDLLDRLVAPPIGSYREDHIRSIQTPVLLANAQSGVTATLAVDLILDGNRGFVPDPLFMGCICLKGAQGSSECDHDENLYKSMQSVWERSGLDECSYRGRWRVTAYNATGPIRRAGDCLQSIEGRSLEAATMIALWAAQGGIPGDKSFQFDKALALDQQAAVTTAVHDQATMPLTRVGHVQEKLDAAAEAHLDSVVLAAEQKDGQCDDLNIERVKTIDDAFQLLLVQNRYMHAYQKGIRNSWLGRWQKGTARASWDDAPGPDDQNPLETQ